MADTTSSLKSGPCAISLAVFCGACATDSIVDPPCPICGGTGLDLRAVQRAIDTLVTERDDARTAAQLNAETVRGLQSAKDARLSAALTALRDLTKQMRDEESNREAGIFADPGCRDCTCGVTPDRYHTGPCALHRAESLLRTLEVQGVR